jgi:hypothetical protein
VCEIVIFSLHNRGTSGIDIDLRRVDINQCPGPGGPGTLNIFGGTDKCKKETTFVRRFYFSKPYTDRVSQPTTTITFFWNISKRDLVVAAPSRIQMMAVGCQRAFAAQTADNWFERHLKVFNSVVFYDPRKKLSIFECRGFFVYRVNRNMVNIYACILLDREYWDARLNLLNNNKTKSPV